MTRGTIAEQILSAKSGQEARAGDVVICGADWVVGTDASSPMAIDYFDQMRGERLFEPSRVSFAFDHYSPPTTPGSSAFHDRMRTFAAAHGAELHEVGEGISFQLLTESGRALPGHLVIGADSHTVTCGALNLFATGVGSSDLAAAMLTGRVWLRVPRSIKVILTGRRAAGVSAKDVALALVAMIGADGANYQALEFHGPAVTGFSLDDRLVMSNLAVEMDAKAAIWPADETTAAYLRPRTTAHLERVAAGPDAKYSREVIVDLALLSPRVALPHAPDNVVPITEALGTPVHMVFLGTCTGGRVSDFHEALAVLERGGGRIASTVQLVATPASREVRDRLLRDGTLARLEAMGAIVTTPGCGACCGTSGVIPTDGMNVLSTANRNFKSRMGNASASIYLASPAACAAAAVTGRITDPRTLANSQ
jgi:3-isopropylmalate/(R)-2-methylmalate dehydratase large subunit